MTGHGLAFSRRVGASAWLNLAQRTGGSLANAAPGPTQAWRPQARARSGRSRKTPGLARLELQMAPARCRRATESASPVSYEPRFIDIDAAIRAKQCWDSAPN